MSLDFRLLFAFNEEGVTQAIPGVLRSATGRRLRLAAGAVAHVRGPSGAGQSVGAAQHPHGGAVEGYPQELSARWRPDRGHRSGRRARQPAGAVQPYRVVARSAILDTVVSCGWSESSLSSKFMWA